MSVLDLSAKHLPMTEDFLIWATEEFETVTGSEPEVIKLTGEQCVELSRDVGFDLRLVELSPVLGNVVAFRGIPIQREIIAF